MLAFKLGLKGEQKKKKTSMPHLSLSAVLYRLLLLHEYQQPNLSNEMAKRDSVSAITVTQGSALLSVSCGLCLGAIA